MSIMFYNCINLNILDLYSLNTSNVNDMSYMFYNCDKSIHLDLSSFYIKKENKISFMLYGCDNLKNIYSIFNRRNKIYISVQLKKRY